VRRRPGADTRSVERVYDSLAPAVLGYFRSHRMADPEGLTGDVFLAVTQRLATFEGDAEALRRWVFTIAHHRRVDEIRRAARQAPPGPPTAEAVADDDPFDPALVAALATLTDEQRQVVVLRHVADLSVEDVAEITGRTPGSVKMLTARGLAALALRLDPVAATPPQGSPGCCVT
jgi:RNA polymerase sigma factor (sigma-70 family)